MRTAIFIFLLLLSGAHTYAKALFSNVSQHHSMSHSRDTVLHYRQGVWFTPVRRSTYIKGLAVGFCASTSWVPGLVKEKDSLIVHGVSIEANPYAIFAAGMLLMTPALIQEADRTTIYGDLDDPHHTIIKQWYGGVFDTAIATTRIRGISISTAMIKGETRIDGLAINGVCATVSEMYGTEISGLVSYHVFCKGVVIAPVNISVSGKMVQIGAINNCREGKGLQIGLFNRSNCGKMVQIGLINKLGSRIVPFVNFGTGRMKHQHPKKHRNNGPL